MKKDKLSMSDLKVTSFITKDQDKVRGGLPSGQRTECNDSKCCVLSEDIC